jgi:hypothetical protein
MSQKQFYQKKKVYIDKLNAIVQQGILPETQKVHGAFAYVALFDQVIDSRAAQLAKMNCEFDDLYFGPYAKALKHWNVVQSKKPMGFVNPEFTRNR